MLSYCNMTWFFIALGAPFLWALVNISDQYLVEHYSKGEHGSGGLVLFSSLIGVFVALIIPFFTVGVFSISFIDKLLLISTGGLSIAWIILYLFTLEIEDVSAVVPWFLTVPIFGYILGFVFLGETLTMNQMIGSAIVLLGVAIISIDFTAGKRNFKWKPVLYMLSACLMIALSGVIFKYVTVGENFWVSSFWEYFGLGIIGLFIYIFVPKYRREFTAMNENGGVRIFILNTLSEFATIVGSLLTNFALVIAPVTMVYLVGSFQPALVLFITLFCTKFFPNIVKENITMRVLVPKIIAIGVMILGSVILFK